MRVLDDRSSGGTFVNGDEVTVANLHDGDIVRIGRVAFRYTEIAPALKRSRAPRRIPLVVRRPGRTGAIGVLVGAVMKATRGKADPARVRSLIEERIG